MAIRTGPYGEARRTRACLRVFPINGRKYECKKSEEQQ
jgi:hypothetical protein